MQLYDFNFIIFLIGLTIVLFIIQVVGTHTRLKIYVPKLQVYVLLLASMGISCLQDLRFVVIISLIILSSYVTGLLISPGSNNSFKKGILTAGICVSVFALGIFKYFNFFASSFAEVLHRDFVAINIILPLGISFYTFTAISYMVDVYRGKIIAERNLGNYALLISFFPKLVAGPIVRAEDFLPQIRDYRGVKREKVEEGIQIFIFGLFKKIVLADRLNVFVNDVFGAPSAFSSITILLSVISYSLQIYFDFSGYSDMAIGASKILGIDIKRNFNLPYIAQNFSEFWNRWHISLSSWFRDYVYIPLGGNRKGKTRTYINLLVVMLISGLWHGAGWTFIIWGFLHGILSCLHRAIRKTKFVTLNAPILSVFRVLFTFSVASLLWVIFRASDINNAKEILGGLLAFRGGIFQPYSWSFFAIACLAVSTIVAALIGKKRKSTEIDGFYPVLKLNTIIGLTAFLTFLGLTVLMGYFGNTAFIYGKF